MVNFGAIQMSLITFYRKDLYNMNSVWQSFNFGIFQVMAFLDQFESAWGGGGRGGGDIAPPF